MSSDEEVRACLPVPIKGDHFNQRCTLPYDLSVAHVRRAMEDFLNFLGFVNQQLHSRHIERLECLLMPTSFSSIVGEFMSITLPWHCHALVRNQYHNGHPDLIPRGMFPGDAVQHTSEGIELKASRHSSGWQGHNPEAVWLMVFHFDSNNANDMRRGIAPKPFCFRGVYAARLEAADWFFSGRSETSRRTITASINQRGVHKMKSNWIYQDLGE